MTPYGSTAVMAGGFDFEMNTVAPIALSALARSAARSTPAPASWASSRSTSA